MTDNNGTKISSDQSTASNDVSQTRQRKKRRWDQPAEALVLAGVALPGLPPQVHQPLIPKLNQPKVQDELVIAREIVINDAESSLRYKLTKRQTQEEIQRCTGAVVITRGKYRPPNSPSDGEKPLYLHISAGAHLNETAERILAVDRAAVMIEEMLAMSNSVKGTQPLTTCVYLGFGAEPSLNIAARIRGPNDQYINHIVNETGATVILRGLGSGNPESLHGEEAQQPLHLFLSSSNSKSLECAKRLAENLLDTISVEFGASRTASYKVYGSVPPPQNLLTGVQVSEQNVILNSTPTLASSVVGSIPACSIPVPGALVYSPSTVLQSGIISNCSQFQPDAVSYPQPLLSRGTSYCGYGGLYPQATPLQQVAQVLRQSSNPVLSTVSPSTLAASQASMSSTSSTLEKDMQQARKRKFKELPLGTNTLAKKDQNSELLKLGRPASDLGLRNLSTMPAPKKLVQSSSNAMLPPPPAPRTMPPPPPRSVIPPSSITIPPSSKTMPPPPPPRLTTSTPKPRIHDKNDKKPETVPDTLVKLLEYGDDDEDEDDDPEEPTQEFSYGTAVRKPFWAV